MNATIQEIEGIDDYWGPAFRSVYEGEGHEAFVQQLDERIVQHDKEIEKLCNFHYQKKRKRCRQPKKLRGVEDQQEALQSRMSQYEDNNNHITKRRRIDHERLGDYINTFPEPDTQCEPSDPLNPSKVFDHDLSDENLEETSEMGISSDEYEEITKYHTLQKLKQENRQLMSKEPDSSTDDLRLYLRNRNRLTPSVEHKELEENGNRLEQQSDFSSQDSGDRQISTRDRRPVVKEVDVNSSDDLRSYLRSKLSDEQYGQRKSYAEHYQGQHEAIQYDERHNHQVDHNRELRRSLFSKYDVGPKQYIDIRYEKGQSRWASVERNKNQIRSLSRERVRTQNRHETIEYDRDHTRTLSSEHTSGLVAKLYEKFQSRHASPEHDRVQRSSSSERNRSNFVNFEYDRGQRRHVASVPDTNQNRKADRQRVKNRPMSTEDDGAQNIREYNERYVRPSRPWYPEHYKKWNLRKNIESSQSPYSFKEHIRPRDPHIISERDGINGQNVYSHQLRGQSHHSAEYDSGDSYSREESTGRPKFRSRPSSTDGNIRQSRPSSSEYKQSFHPIIEYHKHQNQEQARGSLRIPTDYNRKSLSSQESADYDRGQGQALADRRRRIDISKRMSSARYQREIQEKSHALCDKKSQSRISFSEHFVQSGQSTEYTSGRKRSDSSEGHGSRSPPVSADNNIRQNRLSYSEFESQICHKLFEVQKSGKGNNINECFKSGRGSLLSDHISDVQDDISSADITASHNRSYVPANLQLEKSQDYPNRYHVDDRLLKSNVGRQVSSETCIKHHPLLPETQRETYHKSPDREDLSRPLSAQRQPTSVQMCKITLAGQHNSAPGKLIKTNYEGCPAIASSIPCHSVSNRVTSSQIFQNEILELELSHVERNDIENQSFDRPQKKPNTGDLKSCKDGMIDAPETEIIPLTVSSTDISMDVSTPRSKTPLCTTNRQDQNAIYHSLNKDLSSKLTNHIEASVLLTSRGSSECREHGSESFAEMSSIQDISKDNHDSVETVIVDLDLKTDDVHQCTTPEPDVKTDLDRSYDAISLDASNESSMVTDRHIGQDKEDPELKRLPESNVKSEPIDHDTIREISSAVDKIIAQNRQQEETPDYCHKPGHSCETATPSGFIKLEIKQEPDNDTLNSVVSTLETDLGDNSSCGPNNENKQGQATAESSQTPSNDGSFKVSVRDVNSINLLLNGAKIDPFNAVLNKTNESDHIKTNVSAVTADSWYTPRKITLEKYPDKQKKLNIFALVNSCDPRLQPRIKRVIEILNEQNNEFGDVDVAQSEINEKSDITVLAMKHYIHTSSDGQHENIKPEESKQPIVPNLAGKCGKLELDVLKSSKDDCCSSNKVQISPESPQIQDEQLFSSLKPMAIETQVADAIPIYDSGNKNHNINDWIDSVNKVAAICNWSDQQVVEYAIPKIMGNGFDSNITWIVWQEKLRTAFASKVNYGKMLLNMLNTRAKVGDSLVEYFYEKKTLLDKCHITGEKAIECMIFGIEDESVRNILESLDLKNQEQLLTFLSNFKN